MNNFIKKQGLFNIKPAMSLAIVLLLACLFGLKASAQTTLINSNFELGDATGWLFADAATNKWKIGSATNNGGTQGIYVSNDNGSSNNYTNNLITFTHFYKSVTFPASETAVILKFDWKGIGEQTTSSFDYIRVSLSTTAPTNAAMPVSADQLPIVFNSQPGYTTAYVAIPASLATGTKNLIFSWYNDGSLSNGSAGAIDNISLVSAIPAPLSGSLNIPGAYNGFSEAIANLNAHGVSAGGVTFNVNAGSVFNETPTALTATGTVSGPIVFQKSGAGANPLIVSTGTGNFGAAATTSTSGIGDGILVIAGGDYITFDGIDVQSANFTSLSTTNIIIEYGYLIKNASATNGAQNILIKNTSITLNRANTNSRGILQSATTTAGGFTPTAASGTNSFNKYLNLTVKNSFWGVYLLGTAATPDVSCEIGNDVCTNFNTIGDPATPHDIGGAAATAVAYGIRAGNQQDVKIYNNKVTNVSGTGVNDGIFLELFQGTCDVYNNIIRGVRNISTTSTSIISGIGLSHRTTLTHTARIYNNAVSDITSAYTGTATATRIIRGIFVRGTTGLATSSYEIYHNSVSINGGGSLNCSSSCFEIATTSGPFYIVKNNIFANFTPAQTGIARHYCIVTTATATFGPAGTDLDYNNYYLANDASVSGFLGLGSTTPYLNLAAWQGGITTPNPHDMSSQEVDPQFTNALTDLHISASSLNNSAFPYPGYVPFDLDCNGRSDFDFGAYNLESCSGAIGGTVSPSSASRCVNQSYTMTAIGSTSGAGIVYQWEESTIGGGVGFAPVGAGSGANTTVYNTGALSTPGTYYYRLNVTCNGSETDYSNEVVLTVNALPSVDVTPTSTTLCQPGATATTLTATGALTYAWLPVSGLTPSTGNIVSALPLVSTNYTVTGTDVNGCTKTAVSAFTVNQTPQNVTATATQSAICSGGTSNLTSTGSISLANNVGTATTTIGGNNGNPYRSGNGTGNQIKTQMIYTASELLASGMVAGPISALGFTCTSSTGTIANFAVNIGHTTVSTLTATFETSPLTLVFSQATFTPVAGINLHTFNSGTFSWNGVDNILVQTCQTNSLTGTSTVSTYTTASIQNLSMQTSTTSCSSLTGTTVATKPIIQFVQAIPVSYSWEPAGLVVSPSSQNTVTTSLTSTTIYTVTATASSGCSNSSTVTVTVAPLAIAPSSTPSTICAGEVSVLNANVTGGGSPYSFTWNDGVNTFANAASINVSPIVTTTYTLTVTDACSNSTFSTVTITVNTTPSPLANNSVQCGPGIPTASVSSTAGVAGTGQMTWYSALTGGNTLQFPPYNGPLVTTYTNDFNAPGLGNASILGNASVTGSQMQLHPNLGNQYGSLTINASGSNSNAYQVDFDMTTFKDIAATEMADGLSYSFGNDVVSASEGTMNAENGTGTKLKLAFVAYGSGLQGIFLMYNCTTNEQTPTTTGVLAHTPNISWLNAANSHVTLSINVLGQASVTLAGNPIFTNVQLPSAFLSADKSTWKHVMKGRTGGITMGSSIDNLVIQQAAASTGISTYLSSIAATTTLFVSEMGTNGCPSLRTPVLVTVNPPQAITIAPSTISRCPTDAPNSLTASSTNLNYNYTWAPATALNTTSGATVMANPTATTTYTVTGSDPVDGCLNTGTILVTVIAPPSGVTASSNAPICEGANLNLTSVNTTAPYFLNTNCSTGFIDISSTGTSVPGLIGDDNEHNITMPAFTFNGVTYTNARIGNNGAIALGSTTGDIGFTNATLPTTANTAGNILLLPYWDDLDTFLAPLPLPIIKTETVGSLFIIQYINESHNAFKTGTGITFQVQLDLIGGNITYVYDDVIFGSSTVDSGASATIGIQFSSTSALQYSFNTKSLFNGKCVSFAPYASTQTFAWSGPNGSVGATKNTSISNVALTDAGTYTVTVTSPVTGCYSTATTNVVIKAKSAPTTVAVDVCDTYTWPANTQTYTVSGVHSATLINAAGCDSVVILNINIRNSVSVSEVVSSGGCYYWPTNGQLYNASGSYTATLTNSVGCDSVITLNLTILPGVNLRAKAMLSGAYDEGTLMMKDNLRSLGFLPLGEPYSGAPYNKPPMIGVPGGEVTTSGVLAVTGNNAIVDWVYLELRDPSNSGNIVAVKRALIQRDGDIVSHLDGTSPVFFAGLAAGNYFVTVKHRNHLGVMTDVAVPLSSCSAMLDFTTGNVWVKAGELNPPRRMFGNVATLWSSDAGTNKNAKYNGTANDKQAVLNGLGGNALLVITGPLVYRAEDVNMDGVLRYNGLDNDRNVIANTIGVSTPNNIINQHTPN